MIKHISSIVNSPVTSYPVKIQNLFPLHLTESISCAHSENKPQHIVYKGMRLSKLCWNILYEIYLITLTCKRDYGFTAQEISDRFKAKGRKDCGLRKVEEALQIIQSILFFVRKTTRKYPPVSGKEKFRGCYRELTDEGLEFIKYRLSERVRLHSEKARAELNAELNGHQPYSHVASKPLSNTNLKEGSNLDSKSYIHSSKRFDFDNSCFEEYAQQMSNGPAYVEQEAIREEIYDPVLPKYRKTVKTLLDESGLKNESKAEVIKAVVRQQNASTEINSISAVTKKFIADERVRTKTYQTPIKQTFVFTEMTEEEKQKSKEAGIIAFAEIKKLYKLNS